jgi:hypothetical protein
METENIINPLRGLFVGSSSGTEGWIWVDCTPLDQSALSQQQQRIYVSQGHSNRTPRVHVVDPRQITTDLITCVVASPSTVYLGTKRGQVGSLTLRPNGEHRIRWFNDSLTSPSPSPSPHTSAISSLHLSHDMRRLVSADRSGRVVAWNLNDDSITWRLLINADGTNDEQNSSAVTCVALSPKVSLGDETQKKKKRKRQHNDSNVDETSPREESVTLYVARAVDIRAMTLEDSGDECGPSTTSSATFATISCSMTCLPWKCVTPPITQLLLISPPLCSSEWIVVRSQHRLVHVLSPSSHSSVIERSLVCPSIPLSIDVNRFRWRRGEAHILGVTAHVVVVWLFDTTLNESTATVQPAVEIRVSCRNTPISILDAKFVALDQILMVAGSALKPELRTVAYVRDNKLVSNIVVEIESGGGLLLPRQGDQNIHERVAVPTTPSVTVVSGAETVGQKPTLQRPPLDLVDVPLELRVADLVSSNDAHSTHKNPVKEEETSSQHLSESAMTIVTWLTQALHTRDKTAITQILAQTRDRRTIADTVARLPRNLLNVLLNEIASRLSGGIAGHTARAANLIVWLRVVLTQQMVHVITSTDTTLVHTLTRIYQHLHARLAPFSDLLTLAGRLDLLTHQIAAKKMQSVSVSNRPLIAYNEDNSGNVLVDNSFDDKSSKAVSEEENDYPDDDENEDADDDESDYSKSSENDVDNNESNNNDLDVVDSQWDNEIEGQGIASDTTDNNGDRDDVRKARDGDVSDDISSPSEHKMNDDGDNEDVRTASDDDDVMR